MGGFQNIGMPDYFKRYGIKYGVLRGLFTAFPVHFVSDYENKKILYYKKIAKKLRGSYLKYANEEPVGLRYTNGDLNNPVWIYWKQGIESAPEIVKSCVESVKRNVDGDIILLNDDNLKDYLIFPDDIIECVSRKTMSAAAFSDLLRFSLLEHYGGTWIDATVYLSEKLPQYINDSDLFAFRDSFGQINNPALMSVWFLHAKNNSEVMFQTRNIAFAYWKKQTYVMEYLLPYLIFTMVLEEHPNNYEKIPYANSEYSHLLFEYIADCFDEKKFDYLKQLTSVHKLSYKLKPDVLKDKDNFYSHIVSGAME